LRTCENIISIFGLDFQEDYDDYNVAWPVLLMEYAEYGTLDTLQQDISIDTELARILLLDVAHGLQALHQCNIIHGDVKSENVLICRHAQRRYIAKLADFGLSLINPDSGSNRHRLPGGTFLWSAPEIGSAMSVKGLRQTDTYSFGLTAWRVFIGHPNPWSLIPAAAMRMGLQAPGTLNEVVTWAKAQGCFDNLVLGTMRDGGNHPYFRQVIEATLCKDPRGRDLGMVIQVLGRSQVVTSPE
jgi:serine/threonine protein kinase